VDLKTTELTPVRDWQHALMCADAILNEIRKAL